MTGFRSVLLYLTLVLIASGPVSADVLLIDSIESAPAMQTPRNGLNKAQVRQQFGEPSREVPAVGEPPITRWEYNGYTVYFEHDLVLHSVVQHLSSN